MSLEVALKKRSILLSGHATSVALEPEFWSVLEEIARENGLTMAGLIARLDAGRGRTPLASACRLAALAHAGAQGGQSRAMPGATGD